MSGCKFGVMRYTLFKSTNKTMSTQTIPPAVRQQRAIAWLRIKLLPGLLLRLLARAAGWTFVFFATCGILATLIWDVDVGLRPRAGQRTADVPWRGKV